jgi:murein L,D-transpeptidase YafK
MGHSMRASSEETQPDVAPRRDGERRRATLSTWLLAAGAALVLFGCVAQHPATPSAPSAPPVADDRAPLDWARSEPYVVVVRRSCRTLSVYRHGEWVRTYEHVAFGREKGAKVYEGDLRTPSGLYEIVGRREHPRWQRFLLLDYPNLKDRDVHRAAFQSGLAPPSAGGQVGIHGTDKPRFNELGIDWTFGCISLLSPDVRDLYDLVPDGTLVLIED